MEAGIEYEREQAGPVSLLVDKQECVALLTCVPDLTTARLLYYVVGGVKDAHLEHILRVADYIPQLV